jgi:uncharacterized membrane protein
VEAKNRFEIAVPVLFLAAVIVVIIGCFTFNDIFWDGFVWKYFWGPIVADAGGDAGGMTSSYNWVDTLTYGLILAMSAYYIHRLFVALKLRVGLGFFLAMSPIVLIGPSARVLEDMELFNEPIQYIFISPLIYIFLGITTLLTILLFLRLELLFKKGGKWFDRGTFLLLTLPGLTVISLLLIFPDQFNQSVPWWPIALGTVLIAYGYTRWRRSTRWEGGVGAFWTEVLLIVGYFYGIWMTKGEWYDHFVSIKGSDPQTAYLGGLLVIALVIASTFLVWIGIRLVSRKWPKWKDVGTGINIMIVGGHMLDASATFIGIDRYNYVEKHILPSTLMEIFGTAAIMYPLKLVFLIPALYIMDVGMKEEAEQSPHLMALVKLTILILGFAPGARDIIRMALGV